MATDVRDVDSKLDENLLAGIHSHICIMMSVQ